VPIKKGYSTLSFKKEFEVKDIFVKDGSLFVVPNSAQRAETIVEKIQTLAKKVDAQTICVNLCGLNMFDALKIASLTGAYGLVNNINNRYEIIVDSEVTMFQIQLLGLSNVNVCITNENKVRKAPFKSAVKI